MKISLLLIFFTSGSCNNDPITPIDIKPGSRNYTWTVDTVFAPYNSFLDITGSSPNDLWTANPGDGEKIFFHYDGLNWGTDYIPRIFSPKSIYSVDSQTVWSGGREGKIWLYSNRKWQQNYQFSFDGVTDIVFEDIYATSRTNIYAVGQYFTNPGYWGIILHYNGIEWKRISIPQIRTALAMIRRSNNGMYYLLGISNESFTQSTYQFYEFDGNELIQIKTGNQNFEENGGIIELGQMVYFIIGGNLCRYEDGSFVKIALLTDKDEFLNVGYGRSIKDIFLGMRNGIAHYNGINTEYLIKTDENTFVRYGIVFEKDVFMMGGDSKGNNLIFHGKLND